MRKHTFCNEFLMNLYCIFLPLILIDNTKRIAEIIVYSTLVCPLDCYFSADFNI
jgi:hypothetical protein